MSSVLQLRVCLCGKSLRVGGGLIYATRDDGERYLIPCPCREGKSVDELLGEFGVPAAELAHTDESLPVEVRPILTKVWSELQVNSVLLVGPHGTCKTGIGVVCLRRSLERGKTVGYAYVPDVLLTVRESFMDTTGENSDARSCSESEKQALRRYIDPDVLLFDDLGAERLTNWSKSLVSYLIHRRGIEGKRTIGTTNLGQRAGKDGLRNTYGDRVFSRVRAWTCFMECFRKLPDYRQKELISGRQNGG